jgi:signal transduction histidine kinase/ActR/RegA family two-component response regulator
MINEDPAFHHQWLKGLGLEAADLIYQSDSYLLKMTFLSPEILYEQHEGRISKESAQAFLSMSNRIADAIEKHKPGHKFMVVANVAKMKRISRNARKLLIQDMDQWDALWGIVFSGGNWMVRTVGYAISRLNKKLHIFFKKTDEEAIEEARLFCLENTQSQGDDDGFLSGQPPPQNMFDQLWEAKAQNRRIGTETYRVLQQDHWHHQSDISTSVVNFSVLDGRILLAEIVGSMKGEDFPIFHPIQDGIFKELGVEKLDLIIDARNFGWTDAESRNYGELYYSENQRKYPNVILLASPIIRFMLRPFAIMARNTFPNWRLASSLEEACDLLNKKKAKDIAMHDEIKQEDLNQDPGELHQVILQQQDLIHQYQDHVNILVQNISQSAWENLLDPIPIPTTEGDPFNDIYGVIAMMQNDYLELVEEREKATKAAEEANRLKSLFLARMSHDLRTPLNSMMGFAEILAEDETDHTKSENLKMIQSSAEQLKNIINDLFEISSIEAGATRIQMRNIDFWGMLNQLVHSQQHAAQQKGLKLSVTISRGTPKTIHSDKSRLQQVLSNLLTNAIKYTAEGQIDVTVNGEAQENGNHIITIDVKDTGRGIPQSMQTNVFDPFRQVEETMLHPVEGKGLGLAICRELMHSLGGSISLKSQEGGGSTFSISFSAMNVSDDATNKETIAAPQLAGHVLLVEDDRANQLVLGQMLKRIGLEITLAQNGEEALQVLRKDPTHVSLILMDCQMPHMDGWRTTKVIRENLKMDLPILALTAFAQKEDVQRSQEVGMNGFLAKPVGLAELRETISGYLPWRTQATDTTEDEEGVRAQ